MIDWKEFKKDLHWIAETGRGQTAYDIYDKWKKIIEDEIEQETDRVFDALWNE